MNLDELTIGQARELRAALGGRRKAEMLPFKPGEKLLIRTVTMIQLGVVVAIGRDFIIMRDGGWVADTGRFGEMLATGKLNEFERAPSWFGVGRGAVVDFWPWPHAIPEKSL